MVQDAGGNASNLGSIVRRCRFKMNCANDAVAMGFRKMSDIREIGSAPLGLCVVDTRNPGRWRIRWPRRFGKGFERVGLRTRG